MLFFVIITLGQKYKFTGIEMNSKNKKIFDVFTPRDFAED